MREIDTIKSEELESINHERFGSFNPGDEPWIVGGSKTTSVSYSFVPEGTVDHALENWSRQTFPSWPPLIAGGKNRERQRHHQQ